MKICYIFGAGEGFPDTFTKAKEDLVIAADGGFNALQSLNVSPDIAVGDFDSLGFVPNCCEIIKHPVMKDDTDMLLAVKTGLSRGYKKFVIYGGAGGRPDHTFANYQTLAFIAENGGMGFMDMCGYTATVIKNGSLKFSASARGTLSVFAFSGNLSGVTLKGVLYPLDNAELKCDFPLGVSNSFLGGEAEITVKSGTALVFWQGGMESICC